MLNEIKWFLLFPTITEAFKPITNKICFYIFILSYIPVDVYARLSAECSIEGLERSIIKVVWCQREIRLGMPSLISG